MYNVSQNFLNIIKQNGRQFKSSATVRDTTFDDSNIIEIDLEENVNPTDSFMLGGVGSSQLTITLANVPDSLILENAKVSASLNLLVNGSCENVPLGQFTVDEIDKGTDGISTVKLTCYDNMILLEQAYFSDLSYPANIQDVASEICSKAGVTLASTLPSIQISKIDGYTYRETIGFIASFLGGFARFNRSGNLEITTYTASGLSVDSNDYTSSFTRGDSNFTIGKLTCQVDDNTTISAGANGNEIQFKNPIMTQDQLNSIYSTLSKIEYMPYSTDWRGNPAVQSGDEISITDLKGNTYSTFVMDNKLTYKGGLSGHIEAVGKTETGQNFSSTGSLSNSVDRLVTEQANIKVLLADTATIEDLNATNANIQTLYADNASISNLVATKANITDLNATNATVQNLQADKANISDLTASNARISTLEADAESVNNLLAGNLSATNFQAGAITAGSSVIAQGAIGSAQISDLSASKISAGTIDTSQITIAGTNSRLLIKGNRIQVFATQSDNSLYERVSLGDVNGDGSDYGLRVRGADGATVILDENGVKREGITDGSINNAKIGSDANISGTKLDINSVVTTINNSATTTIQSSKVFLNNSTLDVQFGTLSTTVTSQGQSISNQSAQISANTTAISAKVDTQTFSTYQNTVNGQISSINNQLSTQSSSISVLQNQISTKVSSTDVQTAINNLQIGTRNFVLNSNFNNGTSTSWSGGGLTNITTDSTYGNMAHFNLTNAQATVYQSLNNIISGTYTMSAIVKTSNYTNITGIGFVFFYTDGSFTDYTWGVGRTVSTLSNGYYQYIITGSSDSSKKINTVQIRIWSNTVAETVEYWVGNVKFEQGTKATSWTPAPEDFQNQINTANSNISTMQTTINNQQSSISQLNSSISLKVDTSTFSSYQTTVNGQINSINSTLSSQSSSISVLQGQITTKVTQTDINNSINNLQIGGRNLLRNSNWLTDTSYWSLSANVSRSTSVMYNNQNSICSNQSGLTTNSWRGITYNTTAITCSAGQQFTASIYTYTTNISSIDTNAVLEIDVYDANGNRTAIINSVGIVPTANNTWQRFTCTATIPSGCAYVGVYAYVVKNGVLYFAEPKLESGTKATDWTPAPEDVQSQINTNTSSITQLSNQITTKVDSNGVQSIISQSASQVQVAFNNINSTKVTIDGNGLHVSGGSIDGSTITSTSGNTKLTINGASIISTVNNVSAISIGGHSIGFNDYANSGAVAAGMFLSYGSDATNANTTGLCIGTAKGFLGFGKEASDGSGIQNDFMMNYGYNPSGNTEKFCFFGSVNFNNWSLNNVKLIEGACSFTNGGYILRGGGISEISFISNNNNPYLQVREETTASPYYFYWGVSIWASDISLKSNIQDSRESALDTINNIRHRMFNWKDSGQLQRLGYVAQELQQLNDSLVLKVQQEDGYILMQPDETRLIPYITKAIQEEDEKVESLKARVSALETIIDELQAQLNSKAS